MSLKVKKFKFIFVFLLLSIFCLITFSLCTYCLAGSGMPLWFQNNNPYDVTNFGTSVYSSSNILDVITNGNNGFMYVTKNYTAGLNRSYLGYPVWRDMPFSDPPVTDNYTIIACADKDPQGMIIMFPRLQSESGYPIYFDVLVQKMDMNGNRLLGDVGQSLATFEVYNLNNFGKKFDAVSDGSGNAWMATVDEANPNYLQLIHYIAPTTEAPVPPTIESSTMGYWTFNNNVLDTSGRVPAHNGALASGSYTTGFFGNCLSFDGAVTSVKVQHSIDLDPDHFSIEMWVKPNAITYPDGIAVLASKVGLDGCATGEGYLLFIENGGAPSFGLIIDGTQYYIGSSLAIEAGSWSHIAATYDGSSIKIYVNGALAGENTVPDRHHSGWTDPPTVESSSMMGYWTFNNDVNDSTTHDNDGVLTGGSYTTGLFGDCLSFDGSTTSVEVAHDSSLEPSQLSMELWTYVTTTEYPAPLGAGVIAGKLGLNGSLLPEGYAMIVTGGRAGFTFVINGVQKTALSASELEVGKCYHLVGTYDGSDLKLYVNGSLSDEKTGIGARNRDVTAPLYIGYIDSTAMGVPGLNGYYEGPVDNLIIYNKVLTPSEVKSRSEILIPSKLFFGFVEGTPFGFPGNVGFYPGLMDNPVIYNRALTSTDVANHCQISPSETSITSIDAGAPVQDTIKIALDGSGGVLAAYSTFDSGPSFFKVLTSRISNNNNILWQNIEIKPSSDQNKYVQGIVGDSSNGAIVLWSELNGGTIFDLFAQKLRGTDGALQWGSGGAAVCTANLNQPFSATTARMISNGSGGAIIGWADGRDQEFEPTEKFPDAYIQMVDAGGAVKWTNGKKVDEISQNSYYPVLLTDGNGGAYIAYNGKYGEGEDFIPYMQIVDSDGNFTLRTPLRLGYKSKNVGDSDYQTHFICPHDSGAIVVFNGEVNLGSGDWIAQKVIEGAAISGSASLSGVPLFAGLAQIYGNLSGTTKQQSGLRSDGGDPTYLIEPLDTGYYKAGIEAEGIEYKHSYLSVVPPNNYTLNFSNIKTAWPMFQGGSGHTGFSPDPALDTVTVSDIAARWNKSLGATIESSPAVSEGVVVVGCNDNKIYAFDAATGIQKWAYTTGGAVKSAPAIYNGVAYAGSDDGYIYAINLSTGTLNWKVNMTRRIRAPIVAANNRVYVATAAESGNNSVLMLDAATGAQKWTSALVTAEAFEKALSVIPFPGGAVQVNPDFSLQILPGDGIVFAGGSRTGNRYLAINGYSTADAAVPGYEGLPVTSITVRGGLELDPVSRELIPEENTFICYAQGTAVFGVTGVSGMAFTTERLTPNDIGIGNINSCPALTAKNSMGYMELVFGSDNGKLYDFEINTGLSLPWPAKWTFNAGAPIKSSPLVTKNRIYFGDQAGILHVLNLSGTELGTKDLGSPITASPALVSGILYVATQGGGLYALSETAGLTTISGEKFNSVSYSEGMKTTQTPTIEAVIQRSGEGFPMINEITVTVDGNEVYRGSSLEGFAGPSGNGTFDSAGHFKYTVAAAHAIVPKTGGNEVIITAKNIYGFENSWDYLVSVSGTVGTGGGKLDILSGTLLVYPPVFKPLSSNPGENTAIIAFDLTTPAPIKLYIYDTSGRVTWTKTLSGVTGHNEVRWNGVSNFGSYIGNGIYILKVTSGNKLLGSYKIVVFE